MSYSNLHIEDSLINFFNFNPFASDGQSKTVTKIEGPNTVQIITEVQSLGLQLIEQLKHTRMDFERCQVTSVGFIADKGISSIIPLIEKALSNQVITIFIGFDKSILKAVFDGFQFAENHFNMCHVQDDIGAKDGIDTQILPLADPYLHQLHLIGNQAMLTSQSFLEKFENRGFSHHRLGHIRSNLSSIEPEIRSSNIFSVNLNALKYSDAECQSKKSPVGFDVDEVCQLAHYAGRAESNQVFCIYEVEKESMANVQNVHLLTNLIWYFLQGVEFKGSSYPPETNHMKTYLIDGKIENLELEFYKDENHQKWWLKCPVKTNKFKKLYPLIACDYQDYTSAINDRILSDRLRNLIALL